MRNSLLLSSALALALSVPTLASAQQAPAPEQGQDPEVTVIAPDQGQDQDGQDAGTADVTVVPPQDDAGIDQDDDALTAESPDVVPEGEPADTAAVGTQTLGTTMTGSGVEVSADDMMGRPVSGADGESLGEVSDVIVDPETMEMRRLVINSGGFLGFGGKTIALDREQVEIRPEEGIVARELVREDVEALPEYEGETASLERPEPAAPAPAGGMAPGPAPAAQ